MHVSPSTLLAKKKLSELKAMFWSRPDVYEKYMNHEELPSSEDENAADEHEAKDAEDEDADAWAPSDEGEDDGGDDDNHGGNTGSDDDNSSSEEEVSEADSDVYFRFAVNDKIEAYWGGGPLTVACWMDAVVVAIDPDAFVDAYKITWDFNSETVSWVGGDGGNHGHTRLHLTHVYTPNATHPSLTHRNGFPATKFACVGVKAPVTSAPSSGVHQVVSLHILWRWS